MPPPLLPQLRLFLTSPLSALMRIILFLPSQVKLCYLVGVLRKLIAKCVATATAAGNDDGVGGSDGSHAVQAVIDEYTGRGHKGPAMRGKGKPRCVSYSDLSPLLSDTHTRIVGARSGGKGGKKGTKAAAGEAATDAPDAAQLTYSVIVFAATCQRCQVATRAVHLIYHTLMPCSLPSPPRLTCLRSIARYVCFLSLFHLHRCACVCVAGDEGGAGRDGHRLRGTALHAPAGTPLEP